MMDEFGQILGKIFTEGSQTEDIGSIKNIVDTTNFRDVFSLPAGETGYIDFNQRLALIQERYGEDVANKYKEYIEEILRQQDGGAMDVVGFKIQGQAADVITAADAATTPGLTAVETPGNVFRLQGIGYGKIGEEVQPISGVFTPSMNEFMDVARRVQTGDVSDEQIGVISDELNADGKIIFGDEIGRQRAAEAASAVENLDEGITIASKNYDEYIRAVGEAAGTTAEGRVNEIGATATRRGADFMKQNKSVIYLAGLAVAMAVVGGVAARKKNESEAYDTTMEAMPVERNRKPYGIQQSVLNQ
jgi:hypothetical protein